MKVICAWCENEGRETLIRALDLYDAEVTSHGICIDHEKVLLRQIEDLKITQSPRLRRSRRPRMTSRLSGSPTVQNCAIPWRRHRTQRRLSPAQLSLPFDDGEGSLLLTDRELELAPT